MAAIGVPFAGKKHVLGSSCFTFLGVESDFGQGPCTEVCMCVDGGRRKRLSVCDGMDAALRAGVLPSALAARFAGKLAEIFGKGDV